MKHMRIPPRTGVGLELAKGQLLRIVCPNGSQVADVTAFAADYRTEYLSSGRTIDYVGSIYPTTGDRLWSNRSRPMLAIEGDTAGRHDFLLAPCSQEMFERLYGVVGHHPSCYENLVKALTPYGVDSDAIPVTFNAFMNVTVDSQTGRIDIGAPRARPGDHLDLRAEIDLIVGVTACAAEKTNAGAFGPIDLELS